jgi:hypothetical protein
MLFLSLQLLLLYRAMSDLPACFGCKTGDVHAIDGATRTGNLAIGGTKVVFSARASSELDSQSLAFEFGSVESWEMSE